MSGRWPCKDCPERYPACHDHCEKYLAVKKKYDDAKVAERGRDEARLYTLGHLAGQTDKNNKQKRSGRLTYSRKG